MKLLLPLPFDVEAGLRAQVRAQLALQVPAEHVDIVCDLAFHAVQTALEGADRVLSSSSDPRHYLAALAPAVGLIAGRCEQMQAAIKDYAADRGLPIVKGRATFGVPQ